MELRLPAKASAYYLATGIAVKAIGVLSTPLFTRLLSEAEYGSYSFYMTILTVASSVSSAVFSSGSLYSGFENLSKSGVCKSAFFFSLALNAIICILSFAFLAQTPLLVLFIFLQLCCDSVIGIYAANAKHSYSYSKVCTLSVFTSLGSVIISLILVSGTNIGYLAKVYGPLIVSLMAAAAVFPKIVRHVKFAVKSPEMNYVADSTIPFIPNAIATSLSSQADKLMIAYFLGATALAKYSVAHSLGVGLFFAIGALGSVLSPWIVRKLSSGKINAIKEPLRILTILFGAGSIALSAIAPEILRFLAPADYAEALVAVYPIAIATIPVFLSSVSNVMLLHSESGALSSRAAIVGAAVNLLTAAFLIPSANYVGAALALLLSDLAKLTVEHYYLTGLGLAHLIPPKQILKSVSVTAIGVLASALLYNYAFARFLILVPASAIAISALIESKKYVLEKPRSAAQP